MFQSLLPIDDDVQSDVRPGFAREFPGRVRAIHRQESAQRDVIIHGQPGHSGHLVSGRLRSVRDCKDVHVRLGGRSGAVQAGQLRRDVVGARIGAQSDSGQRRKVSIRMDI